jgi:hypothetical protein
MADVVLAPAFKDQRRVQEKRQCSTLRLLRRNGERHTLPYAQTCVHYYPAGEKDTDEIIFHTPQEEAVITGGALLAICTGLEERTLPLLAESGTPPVALPDVRADEPDSQENQALATGQAPVIHSIIVRERV